MKKYLLLPLILLFPLFSMGVGIMASDLTWVCIGKDSFLIKLNIYTDCNQEKPGEMQVNVYCKQNYSLLKTLNCQKPSGVDITPCCHEACTRCTNPSCSFQYGIEQYAYRKLLILDNAGSCCEILFSLSACCRNSALTTIADAGKKSFYTEASLNRCLSPCDNGPDFTNPPIGILCQGLDFVYNDGRQDFDIGTNGQLLDSVGYELVPTLRTKDSTLDYIYPYTYDKPLYFKGFPDVNAATALHFSSGEMLFTPQTYQQTILCVKISEYRNKLKIGEMRRNMNFIIIPCPVENPPVFMTDTFYKETFAGQLVRFTIPSFDPDMSDSLSISWNHGIPVANWTDNNGKVQYPTGIFEWVPLGNYVRSIPYTFTVRLRDDHCPVGASATRSFQVLVKSVLAIDHSGASLGFGVFPNPGNGQFAIHFSENISGKFRMAVTDISGRELFTENVVFNNPAKEFPVDLISLESGMYFVRIQNENKQGIAKLIIER